MTTNRPTVAELIERGAIQLSRKYRRVGILPEGQAALEMLQKHDPVAHRRILERAQAQAENEARAMLYHSEHMETFDLSHAEFNEWLTAHGRSPQLAGPSGAVCPECRTWTDNHARGCARGAKP